MKQFRLHFSIAKAPTIGASAFLVTRIPSKKNEANQGTTTRYEGIQVTTTLIPLSR
jgi:hypothetical protein